MVSIEKALVDIAEKFKAYLEKDGYNLEKGDIKGYGIKVSIIREDFGESCAVIYYKPTKNTYSLVINKDADELIAEKISNAWHDMQNIGGKVDLDLKGWHIYVDGSYSDGFVGYGMVAIYNGQVIREYYGPVQRKSLISSRQIGGEIAAVIRAVKWCQNEGIKNVTIHHDLLSLEKWATGVFKTNTDMTTGYKKYIQTCGINIKWKKVVAHTGDRFNERADELAKKGANAGMTAEKADIVNTIAKDDEA